MHFKSGVLGLERYFIRHTSPLVGVNLSLQSSLTLSLLRCIYTEGAVYYDGIPTTSVNLDALRSNITIIPQMVSVFAFDLDTNLSSPCSPNS